MSCIEKVRELIFSLALKAYTFIHFESSGTPNAVYKALAKLIEQGIIRSDARGVYSRISASPLSVEEIAVAKAERFGKRIFSSEPVQEAEFRTDGCTSSFETKRHGRIHFSHAAPRNRRQVVSNRADQAAPTAPSQETENESFVLEQNTSNHEFEQPVLHTIASLLAELLDLLSKDNPYLSQSGAAAMRRKRKERKLSFASKLLLRNAKRYSQSWKSMLQYSMADCAANTTG